MHTCGNKSCDVRNVNHHICTDLITYLSDTLKINSSCICTGTRKNHLGFTLHSDPFHFIVIYESVLIYSVMNTVKVFTRNIDR